MVVVVHTHKTAKVVYQAESPDEKALIEASLENQYFFYHREPKAFKVGKLDINGTEIRVNVRGEPVVCAAARLHLSALLFCSLLFFFSFSFSSLSLCCAVVLMCAWFGVDDVLCVVLLDGWDVM